MLDNKKKYAEAHKKYNQMPLPQLQEELQALFSRRYNEYDIDSIELHRVASAIYNQRTRSGTGLIFHLNKFLR
jgi:hypothetical protein